ncbi:MAG: zinc ribbon domain-containing protein [Acidobacteria bacterium]|nr:zinc ribbon domain-containing protein [Acidobacteriota bacterium]
MGPGEAGGRMYCPQCGLEHPDVRKFCNRCGTNLDVVSRALASVPRAELDHKRGRRRIFARGFLYFSIGPTFSLLCLILQEILSALGANEAWVLERVALLGPFGMLLAALWTIYQLLALGTEDSLRRRPEINIAAASPGPARLSPVELHPRWSPPGTVTESTTYSLSGREAAVPLREEKENDERSVPSARYREE